MSDVRVEQRGDDVLVWIRAVPGASRDTIAGVMGDRLKVRVSAPPEGGKANDAVCSLIARRLGLAARAVRIETGPHGRDKVVRISGGTAAAVTRSLLGG